MSVCNYLKQLNNSKYMLELIISTLIIFLVLFNSILLSEIKLTQFNNFEMD